MIKHQVDKMI